MPHYKDQDGNLHFLENPSFSYLLPAESVMIDVEEVMQATAIKQKQNKPQAIRDAVRTLLNSTAVEAGFDSMEDAVSYANESAVPEYQILAKALRSWRSLVKKAMSDVLDDIKVNHSDPSLDDVISNLPSFTYSSNIH